MTPEEIEDKLARIINGWICEVAKDEEDFYKLKFLVIYEIRCQHQKRNLDFNEI